MVGHKLIFWPGTRRDFAFGQTYTRGEIRQALGGDLSSSFPHRDGRVVCGCFRPDLNPDAPDVILSGRGPKIERWAQIFATQRDYIPCFVKADTNAWEYVGRFCVRRAFLEARDGAVGADAADEPLKPGMTRNIGSSRRKSPTAEVAVELALHSIGTAGFEPATP